MPGPLAFVCTAFLCADSWTRCGSPATSLTTLVPAFPATIPAMSASEPIAARWPVLAANRVAASTLGPMDPAANS